MLSDTELQEFIQKKCTELGITAYDISKNIELSEVSIRGILNGETKNPRRKNLLKIVNYLEETVLGSSLEESQNVVMETVESRSLSYEDCVQQRNDLILKNHELHLEIERLRKMIP